jgi:hypothetical protein
MIEITVHHEIEDRRQPQQADLLEQLLPFMEKIVSQLDDLQSAQTAIKADLDFIKDHVASQADKLTQLSAQLEQLNQTTPPQVDLSGAVSLANEIRDEAQAIVDSFGPQSAPVGGDPAAGDGSAGSGSDTTSSTGGGDTGSSTSDSTGASGSGDSSSADAGSTTADPTGSGDAGGTLDGGAAAPGGDTGSSDAGASDGTAQPGPDQGGGDAQPGDQSGLDQQP